MPASKRSKLPILALFLILGGGVAAYFLWFRPTEGGVEEVPLWTVRRGPMEVTVLEGGGLEALESHTVVSRVEGQAAILYIVDEGTHITKADVQEQKVIVRLDSSGIEEKLERQKIDLASARAAYENAVSNLVIQRQQNASDLRTAELDVRFALLDLARYVGSDLVEDLLTAHATAPGPTGDAPTDVGAAVEAPADAGEGKVGVRRLILTLLQSERLEGESQQTIRRLDSDISLADEEHKRAAVELDWSKKLEDKGYVSREEREADRIALERRKIELERATTAREQFARYDFPKEVERLLSNLIEAEDQLSRSRKRADSAEAKAVAEADSRREQQALQEARHKKLNDQLGACVIRADRPGLVVYASSGRGRRNRGERIQEGATVRERQPIIKIPNLAQLGVKADIHESMVERVEPGQPVSIVVDALPDQPFKGVVQSVAPLPNPSESWFNPDRKVYATTITLDAVPPNVRPGMSAQVEIRVADLEGVLLVPVQAITGTAEQPTVHVSVDGDTSERPVRIGWTNDRFAEVTEGLTEGQQVLLAPPEADRLAGKKDEKEARKRPGAGSGRPGRKPGGGSREKSGGAGRRRAP